MHSDHDPASAPLALPSESSLERAPQPTRVEGDPLSDVLKAVRLNAAVYFLIDASSPYCVDVPHTDAYRTLLQRGVKFGSFILVCEICALDHRVGKVDPYSFFTKICQ